MNKERELLKKVLATGWLDHTLSCEVEELLDQPEQEQEPVEDRIARWHKLGFEQGKKASQREPLSDDEIEDIYEEHSFTVHAFARAIEKAHGVTGGGE